MNANPATIKHRPKAVPAQTCAWPDEVFIAVETTKGTVGWAVVHAPDGRPESFKSGASATAEDAVAAAVAAAIALADQLGARQLLVTTAHSGVEALVGRQEVLALGLAVVRVDSAGMHPLGSAALRQARRDAELAAAPPGDGQHHPRMLVAAVDGSWGRRRGCGGWAFVIEGGRHAAGSGRVRGSLEAELLAVELLLRMTRASDQLTVQIDCREAINILTGTHQPPTRLAVLRDRISDLLQGREVAFAWVKGHAGHSLNEAANRLAIAERRHLEWGSSPEVHATIRRNILREELGLAA